MQENNNNIKIKILTNDNLAHEIFSLLDSRSLKNTYLVNKRWQYIAMHTTDIQVRKNPKGELAGKLCNFASKICKNLCILFLLKELHTHLYKSKKLVDYFNQLIINHQLTIKEDILSLTPSHLEKMICDYQKQLKYLIDRNISLGSLNIFGVTLNILSNFVKALDSIIDFKMVKNITKLMIEKAGIQLIDFLLSNGANKYEQDEKGRTPLFYAIANDLTEITVKLLAMAPQAIAISDNQHTYALAQVIKSENFELLEKIANNEEAIHNIDPTDFHFLHFFCFSLAFKEKNYDTFMLLLKIFETQQGDMNLQDGSGYTILHAISLNYYRNEKLFDKLLKELFERNIDPSITDNNNQTAIDIANQKDYPGLALCLTEQLDKINIRKAELQTPIFRRA